MGKPLFEFHEESSFFDIWANASRKPYRNGENLELTDFLWSSKPKVVMAHGCKFESSTKRHKTKLLFKVIELNAS